MDISNIGKHSGKEVVQLYIHPQKSRLKRPEQELKVFYKIELVPGETLKIQLNLSSRDFSYYDPEVRKWVMESGPSEIRIGSSSRDIRLKSVVIISPRYVSPFKFTKLTPLGKWLSHPEVRDLVVPIIDELSKQIGDFGGDEDVSAMMEAMFKDLPLIKLVQFTRGSFSEAEVKAIVKKANKL